MSRFRFAFPLLLSLLCLTFARAQNFELGNRHSAGEVSGTVRDANGAPLSGVSVELRVMPSGLTAFSTTTSTTGFFALYNIPSGQYEVIARGRESDASDVVTVGSVSYTHLKAFVMGGVSGHAGLFAPVENVARFAECMLRGGAPILRPATVALFTKRERSPQGTSRALGWDTPSQPSSSGRYFSPSSFGHLGFTGTSLWIDPARRLSITLLTNRTWPNRAAQGIRQIRPALHDAVVEALETA